MTDNGHITHEQFVQSIRDSVAARQDSEVSDLLHSAKLVYGIGSGAYRGICWYDTWINGKKVPMVEIAASGEESPIQLAGTVIHELGHVLAGNLAGHGKDWKAACDQLGLHNALAVGHIYSKEDFDPAIWYAIRTMMALGISDGGPNFHAVRMPRRRKGGFCPVGIGTRGGTSRGKGSGSRLRLYVCDCEKPVKVRVASDEFAAHCDHCNASFHKQDS